MTEKKLYKVLVNGRSCHGGDLAWSLPDGDTPGEWHRVEGDLAICRRGLHLTDAPYANWYKWGAAVYEAEAEGVVAWDDDKCVCRAARLLRECEEPCWLGSSVSFVASIKDVPWFRRVSPPDAAWRVFPTRDAALDGARAAAWSSSARNASARAAAWSSARNASARAAAGDAAGATAGDAAGAAAGDAAAAWTAAGDAAGDAGLLARCLIASDMIDPKHLDHAMARWRVWESGYGLLCDVGGVLYVYEKP